MIRRMYAALASYICPNCGWWASSGHQCHPADQ